MKSKNHLRIDLSNKVDHTEGQKARLEIRAPVARPSSRLRKFVGMLSVVAGVLFFGVVGMALVSNQSISDTIQHLPLIGDISRLISSSGLSLDGSREGRTNILLLGVGGAGHEGPDLSDTIMVVSINHDSKRVGMISIPRDLIVPIRGHGMRKINEANAIGESRDQGSGGELARETVAAMLDIPLHYYLRVDFAAFEEIVDALGGIDIYVEKSFDDPYYPLGPNQYQTVSFSQGSHHFDGATALKYARSRYTTSDFDRAKRQQDILKALKDKALSLKTWLDPSRVFSLWRSVAQHSDTNLSRQEIQALIGMLPSLDTDTLAQLVLTDAPDNFLYSTTTPETGFILVPRDRSYTAIRTAAQNIFSAQDPSSLPSSTPITNNAGPIARDQTQDSSEKILRVAIHNGTTVPGLAQKTSDIVSENGFSVTLIGNAEQKNTGRTIIFDLTEGANLEKLAFLKGLLEADIADIVPPDIKNKFAGTADLYIVIGVPDSTQL